MSDYLKKALEDLSKAMLTFEPLRIASHEKDDIRFNEYDKVNNYLYHTRFDLLDIKNNKGCAFCKHGEPLNDTANSDLTVNIYQDGGEHILGCDYDDGESTTDCTGTVIHYCPMCGRKLEVAE